jgi:hypothetical protein
MFTGLRTALCMALALPVNERFQLLHREPRPNPVEHAMAVRAYQGKVLDPRLADALELREWHFMVGFDKACAARPTEFTE